METKQRIGLFFGSFNPIHIGHLIIANTMAEHTDLHRVWLVLSPHNPHKQTGSLLHAFDRYNMAKAAVADHYKIEVSDVEFHLPQPNYTVHTLAYLTEKYPTKEFILILGEDNLESFTRWKNYEVILNNYDVYVYPRPRPNKLSTDLHDHPRVHMVEAPLLNISATYLRRCIREGKSIRYLTPDSVEKMIQAKQFYTAPLKKGSVEE